MASELTVEQAAAKIIRRYEADVPEVKQFLRPGEDRILLALISSLVAERDAARGEAQAFMEGAFKAIDEKREAERLLAEAEAAMWGMHERGFVMKALIDPPTLADAITALKARASIGGVNGN